MARSRRRSGVPVGVSDLLVLDADGVSKAAEGDRSVQAWLERARELDADVIVSAVTLTEVLRGVPRDAGCNRVLKAVDLWTVDEQLARRAGRLLGRVGGNNTVDAVVAATAITACEQLASGRCVVLTSDPGDLRGLLSESLQIHVRRV